MKVPAEIAQVARDAERVRRDIHAHPELAFQEFRTAGLVAKMLREWGIEVATGVGRTGVVGTLKAGTSARSIALRADMDALPIHEANRFKHASKTPGCMHACGHDGHTAMLLAAACYLAGSKNFNGTVHFIFQPAEEGGGGAAEMISDGLFERFAIDAVFGMHNWPGMPAGALAVSPGPVMASMAEFSISVAGRGCHAAMPQNGIDPIVVAAAVISAIQTIVSRNLKPIDSAVVSVTKVHAGDATNVIPERCELAGTVRTFSSEVESCIEERLRSIVEKICAAHGASGMLEFRRKYPATVNAPEPAAFARNVMQSVVGPEMTLPQEPTMGAEDFAFMLHEKPGAYSFIGNGTGDHRGAHHGAGPCTLHNPSYDFNDELLPIGAAYWVRLVESWLARDSGHSRPHFSTRGET